MIEQIRGELIQKLPTFCVVESGGIGIGVFISVHTYQKMGEVGSPVQMKTYLHVREDALQLFGFFEEEERQIFRQLIGVGGIGPRLAITILSGISTKEFAQAIALEDVQLLTKIPGVGKKTAQRMIVELKDKIEAPLSIPHPAIPSGLQKINGEAVLALSALGYRQSEARTAVEKVLQRAGKEPTLEELIKLALREI
jgi:Holliday junction DNA helicase RuvA